MLMYGIMRSIGIETNDGDYECISEQVIYLTSSLEELVEKYDIGFVNHVKELKEGDFYRLEGFNRNVKLKDETEDNMTIEYSVIKKELDIKTIG